jgi:hypothetical protein
MRKRVKRQVLPPSHDPDAIEQTASQVLSHVHLSREEPNSRRPGSETTDTYSTANRNQKQPRIFQGVHFTIGASFGIIGSFLLLEDRMPRPKPLSRAEKKAALMHRAEALIEELLDWTEQTAHPNLTQIEDIALELRQQFGHALSETALASQENVAPVKLPACPDCGKPMRPKGTKDKTVLARVGELKLERSHFYCPQCEQGLFPPR